MEPLCRPRAPSCLPPLLHCLTDPGDSAGAWSSSLPHPGPLRRAAATLSHLSCRKGLGVPEARLDGRMEAQLSEGTRGPTNGPQSPLGWPLQGALPWHTGAAGCGSQLPPGSLPQPAPRAPLPAPPPRLSSCLWAWAPLGCGEGGPHFPSRPLATSTSLLSPTEDTAGSSCHGQVVPG